MTRLLSFSHWLYFFFPSFLSSCLAYGIVKHAPSFRVACWQKFDSWQFGLHLILWSNSLDILSTVVCFLALVFWRLICSWVAIWEAQPIFVLLIFNPLKELNFWLQTSEKSIWFSLIVILLSFVPFGSIILPPFWWIPRAFSVCFVCSYCTMISGLLAWWDHLVFPSIPCLSRCQLVCSQLPFSLFLKVNGQSIGLKKEVTYQVTETHQKVSR